MAAKPDAPQMPALTDSQFRELLDVLVKSKDPSPNQEVLVKSLQAQIEVSKELSESFKRTQVISNKEHQDISPFTYDPRCAVCKDGGIHAENGKRGHPKPALKREVIFCNGKQWEDSLTPIEIELLNSFTHNRTARNGTWTAHLGKNGHTDRLTIEVPYRGLDARVDLPSFTQILTELLFGEAMADPANQMQLIQDLQRQIRELQARPSDAAVAAPVQ